MPHRAYSTQRRQHAGDKHACVGSAPEHRGLRVRPVRNGPICPHGTMPCHRSQAGASGAGGRASESAGVLASGTTVCSPDLHDREEQVDDERMPHRHVQAAEAHRRHLRRRRLHDDEQDVDQHQQGHHLLVEAASVSHGEGSEAAGAGRVPVQMWRERAQSRCRCGGGGPSPLLYTSSISFLRAWCPTGLRCAAVAQSARPDGSTRPFGKAT